MPRDNRLRLINELEQARGSRVVAYVTSDRRGAEAKIASDAIPWLYSHLSTIGKVSNLDLFLYSVGGVTMAGYRVAMLFRDYCDRFCVIVPYKAHSAATLIALAADELVMLDAGELSPVDPSTTSPFNPQPSEGMPPAPVPVESVAGYFSLVTEQAGKEATKEGTSQLLVAAFKELADKVHPLALGGVYRARQQIRMLAKKLLGQHMGNRRSINKITKALTEELLSHDYPITRTEARDLGLPIVEHVEEAQRKIIWELYEDYSRELKLLEPYNPEVELGTSATCDIEMDCALVESSIAYHTFRITKRLSRREAQLSLQPGQPPVTVPQIQEQILSQSWARRSED